MEEAVLPGDPPIAMVLRRSARAKRICLRVSALDGRVTLTLPPAVTLAQGMAFARARDGWIRRHAGGGHEPLAARVGARIPVLGRERLVRRADLLRPCLTQTEILLPPHGPQGPWIAALLKEEARRALHEASLRHAAAARRDFTAITLRDTRSRWGSCSSEGRLMYSWRLILAPCEVLDYVAAHEVAHLVHMDHSARFWAEVERLLPGHAPARAWLRANGATLHRWRFDD
ncbi:M48 family metallopeptidase [Profundibacterium mesophilum]|uniref:Zinc metallopeptidase-like protein n=1 Tax=Profundibacterium mesophilum KAUST100406-0324 TaxID=1037889 RepID=A0A921NRJ8_9RHOB|nr:SprT family zinc-dependent metalloprotease [Profundibacterium mesophilum]KAF0677362.1 Zinc metallopeptidase-like protein [Profundibacterium mesophilum KAUST100406-0324]